MRPPRGYYEAVVMDPDGNRVEITALGSSVEITALGSSVELTALGSSREDEAAATR